MYYGVKFLVQTKGQRVDGRIPLTSPWACGYLANVSVGARLITPVWVNCRAYAPRTKARANPAA